MDANFRNPAVTQRRMNFSENGNTQVCVSVVLMSFKATERGNVFMEPVVYQSVLSCSFLCLCVVDLRMEQEGHGRDIEYVFFFFLSH